MLLNSQWQGLNLSVQRGCRLEWELQPVSRNLRFSWWTWLLPLETFSSRQQEESGAGRDGLWQGCHACALEPRVWRCLSDVPVNLVTTIVYVTAWYLDIANVFTHLQHSFSKLRLTPSKLCYMYFFLGTAYVVFYFTHSSNLTSFLPILIG